MGLVFAEHLTGVRVIGAEGQRHEEVALFLTATDRVGA